MIGRAAIAGMVGPIIFALTIAILTFVQYDFMRGLGWHPIEENPVPWPSGLALGPYGWLQVMNFIVFSLLTLIFAFGLHRGLPKGSIAGPALVALAGIGTVLAAFKTDPHALDTGPISLSGWIHVLGFLLLALSLLLGIILIGWRLRSLMARLRLVFLRDGRSLYYSVCSSADANRLPFSCCGADVDVCRGFPALDAIARKSLTIEKVIHEWPTRR